MKTDDDTKYNVTLFDITEGLTLLFSEIERDAVTQDNRHKQQEARNRSFKTESKDSFFLKVGHALYTISRLTSERACR